MIGHYAKAVWYLLATIVLGWGYWTALSLSGLGAYTLAERGDALEWWQLVLAFIGVMASFVMAWERFGDFCKAVRELLDAQAEKEARS